ncbi:retrotransposon protein, putative, ty1-copia subclass [Tanacetum coccineum]
MGGNVYIRDLVNVDVTRISKDNEDPSWSTSFKTRRTQKTSSALEALWKTLFVLYLYLIGTLIQKPNKKLKDAKGKGKCKGKSKLAYAPKPKNPSLAKKEHPTKDATWHHYKELTPSYTPQHNGVSERRNHTLVDMVRSMMNLTTLPLSFWDYAIESAKYILNMVPTKKVHKTPYELWHGKLPNLTYLKDNQRETMGYYFYFPSENKIVVASEHLVEVESLKPQEDVAPVCRSIRRHQAPKCLCLNVEVKEHSLGDLNEHTKYKPALSDPEFAKWLDAMNAEMQSMKDNQVCRLVDLPPNGKTVGSKWLFKKKTDMDGNVHTYKARLVAKGYT